MKRVGRIVRHAATMVLRYRQSYAMLSVTIVLSFCILLSYFGYTDTANYNRYKKLFSQDPNLVVANGSAADTGLSELLIERAKAIGNTQVMEYLSTGLDILISRSAPENRHYIYDLDHADIYCIPDNVQSLCLWDDDNCHRFFRVTWLDGQEHPTIRLGANEILVDQYLFAMLGLSAENPVLPCAMHTMLSSQFLQGRYQVVGYIEGPDTETPQETWQLYTVEDENSVTYNYTVSYGSAYRPIIIFPLQTVNPEVLPSVSFQREVLFYTDMPTQVTQVATSLGYNVSSRTWERQTLARQQMQTENRTKAFVAALLLLLLGINLYSSFTNALHDRQFEIGVKRAIGASRFAIIRQFLYEGVLVMLTDILLSVVLVTGIGILYKYIKATVPNAAGMCEEVVLYISPYSVWMFAVCAVSLTVVFSLIFAYKSTQVAVVDYLKSE